MADKKSFTGRARRLTNRWSVWLSDRVAQLCITIGGIATIVAVLLVFVFLLYVALPLFRQAHIENGNLTQLETSSETLLAETDENQTLYWRLDTSGKFLLYDLQTHKLISDQQLTSASTPTCAALIPEPTDADGAIKEFAVGLASGAVVLVKLKQVQELKRSDSLPDSVLKMERGERQVWEKGILEHTEQGLFRWQTVQLEVGEPTALSEHALSTVDFQLITEKERKLAATSVQGEVFVANVTSEENILTGETTLAIEPQTITLPTSHAAQAPWRVHLMGRGTDLVCLWRDGRLLRLVDLDAAKPTIADQLNVLSSSRGEITASLMLQMRSTLMIGESSGSLSAWFAAREKENDSGASKLFCGHVLPSMSSAITSLARSTHIRMVAAGAESGEVAVYHITSERKLASHTAFSNPVVSVQIAPNDDALIAFSKNEMWQANFEPYHPEVTFSTLFQPVWYEDYDRPLNKWQSTSGTDAPEPKLGVWPLVFGTLKATFYSMMFAVPLALMAAIYTSEFIDVRFKSPIKSSIELMAVIPSVVLGYLAGLVFAPFVENVLPTVLTSFLVIPFLFMLAAQLWQLLPRKYALPWARYRLLLLALTLGIGFTTSSWLGPIAEIWLFAGNFKEWLQNHSGDATGGWFFLLMPGITLLVAAGLNNYVNPRLRISFGSLTREAFAAVNLVKFLLAVFLTCASAYLLGAWLSSMGYDLRGGIFDSYSQKNSLIVGFVMGFAVIPIIYTISEDALSTVPQHLRSASLGCGATPWQTTWRIVLPTAASGLFSAIMVGFGRSIGETMIMLMATGNMPLTDINMFNGFRSLSANIAEELPESAPWSTHFRLLFFTGLILLVLTFFINTLAEMVRISFRRRARQL
jgi:phosphate transport system permease protein